MSSIIDLIYYSDCFRTTDNSSFGDEYKSAIEKVCKAEKQLLNRFPDCAEIVEE